MSIEAASSLSGEQFARGVAGAAADKKAGDIVILDLRGISSFTDFFVICSGSSEPQIKAISSAIREYAREEAGQKLFREDGFPAAQWIAVDFGEVIVHIFHEERRSFYDLESLWRDAPRLRWES